MQLAFIQGDYAADADMRARLMQSMSGNLSSKYIRQAVVRAVDGVEFEFLSELISNEQLVEQSREAEVVLSSLANNAYRTLRGDLTSSELAHPELENLLALIESLSNENNWQQLAMLNGIAEITATASFVSCLLYTSPSPRDS